MSNKLYRSETNQIIAGVFGGLGEYFHVDATILRLIYVVLSIFTAFFPFAILYLAAVLIIPRREAP